MSEGGPRPQTRVTEGRSGMDEAERLTIEYRQIDLGDVMRYFAKGFEGDIADVEWFVDTAKAVVVFKLYLPASQARRNR